MFGSSWGSSWDAEEQYKFNALGTFFSIDWLTSTGFNLAQGAWDSNYHCKYVHEEQGKENIKNLKIPE